MKTELTKLQKGYLNELFNERLNKLNEIEKQISRSLALSMDNTEKTIQREKQIINSIKEQIYTY